MKEEQQHETPPTQNDEDDCEDLSFSNQHNQESWNQLVKKTVCKSLYNTVSQLCGGCEGEESSTKNNLMISSLNELCDKSVSFPNNNTVMLPQKECDIIRQSKKKRKLVIKKNNGLVLDKENNIDIGKPHDIAINIAFKLFHKYKQQQQQQQHLNNTDYNQSSDQLENNEKGKKKDKKNKKLKKTSSQQYVLNITSDLGFTRTLNSPKDLANLIARSIEEEISSLALSKTHSSSSSLLNKLIHDIRVDQSGFILLITKTRHYELLWMYNKIACPKCIKYLKGKKGLWWHMQMEHGIDHSDAMEYSSSMSNHSVAIIPYKKQDDSMIHISSSESNREENESMQGECAVDEFDLVKQGDLIQFKERVENGLFNPKISHDRKGAFAIHWAAGCGHLPIVKYLIEIQKVDPNTKQKGRLKSSFHGRTPLHWSCRNGHLKVVKYLGNLAVEEEGKEEVVRTQQQKQQQAVVVDIDAVTSDGTTAFCWATWQGHLSIMEYLYYEKKCDVHKVNSFGCNAVLWCSQGGLQKEKAQTQERSHLREQQQEQAQQKSNEENNSSQHSQLNVLKFLCSIGCDITLINSNGHGAIHKAAQRESEQMCLWLLNLEEEEQQKDVNFMWTIHHFGPDNDGCCPSDLCGMGYKSTEVSTRSQQTSYIHPNKITERRLTHYLSEKEKQKARDLVQQIQQKEQKEFSSIDEFLQSISNNNNGVVPKWLIDSIQVEKVSKRKFYKKSECDNAFVSGGGVRRMALAVLEMFDD